MKRIVIMGATSGIGLETAKLFIADGWTVGVAGRRTAELAKLATLAPGRVFTAGIDINSDDAPALLDRLADECGGMDVYLHCSGIGYNNPTLSAGEELFTVETNVKGFTRMVDAAFNRFVAKGGGQLAAITSVAVTRGLGAAPAYSAGKRYQANYLSALRQQAAMRHAAITVTDLRPGFVKTALLAGKGYPMQLDVKDVARAIFSAIVRRRRVAVIDWRYALMVAVWRLIPRCIWERWPVNVK